MKIIFLVFSLSRNIRHVQRNIITIFKYSSKIRFFTYNVGRITLLSIALVDINTSVCKLPIMSSISNCSSNSDIFAGTVLKVLKTIGTITVFTLINLLTCSPPYQSLPHLTYYNSHWFVPIDCGFTIISLCYNIGCMAVPLIFCRDPILLE